MLFYHRGTPRTGLPHDRDRPTRQIRHFSRSRSAEIFSLRSILIALYYTGILRNRNTEGITNVLIQYYYNYDV